MNRLDLIKTFRQMGIRVTAQRMAVADILVNSKDHPTVQDVYERLQEHFPHITLGTIYNTMNVLAEKGFVQPLLFQNGTRYDINLLPHANLVCVECGKIVDAADEDGAVEKLRELVSSTRGFEVFGQRVDFYGRCADCSRRAG